MAGDKPYTPHQLVIRKIAFEEYAAFCAERGMERGENAAHAFAIYKQSNGISYGMSEREIILLVHGKLPFMWD